MATVHGKYVLSQDKQDDKDLCFICAVRAAMDSSLDPENFTTIAFETDNYEYFKCSACGSYIKDTVDI